MFLQPQTLFAGTLPMKNQEPIAATNLNTRYNSVHHKASDASTRCDVVDPEVTAPTVCAMHLSNPALDFFFGFDNEYIKLDMLLF